MIVARPRRLAAHLRSAGAAACLMLAAACSREPQQPGAIGTDEARQLDRAGAMLNEDSVALNALTTDNRSDER